MASEPKPHVQVDAEVYAAILTAKGEVERETGKPASLNEGLRRALGLDKKKGR